MTDGFRAMLKSPAAGIALMTAVWLSAAAAVSADVPTLSGDAQAVPLYSVADPSAPVLTADNLQVNDVFWPYSVSLVSDFETALDGRSLGPGRRGVLIRIENSGLARIDFGRNGIHEVPVDKTDILPLANQIRSGTTRKLGPNLAVAVGRSLADPTDERLDPYRYRLDASETPVVCVFADPKQPHFDSLAHVMSGIERQYDFTTLYFPAGEADDRQVARRLAAVGWQPPFAYRLYSKPLSRSLLGADIRLPAVLVLTNDGRVMLQSEWDDESESKLRMALERINARR